MLINYLNLFHQLQLYIWDEVEYLPLLVKNKAAEVLFGNISAERVYQCYRKNKDKTDVSTDEHPGKGSSESEENEGRSCRDMNFHSIWLILLRMLLLQGKNSPLKFHVDVNARLDTEDGRFEMVSMSMPCFGSAAVNPRCLD